MRAAAAALAMHHVVFAQQCCQSRLGLQQTITTTDFTRLPQWRQSSRRREAMLFGRRLSVLPPNLAMHGQWALLQRRRQTIRTVQLHRQGLEVLRLPLQLVHIWYALLGQLSKSIRE